MYIYPYMIGSKSAKALADGLGWKRIKRKNSEFVPKDAPFVVNWGCSGMPDWVDEVQVINHPDAVHEVANKRLFFRALNETEYAPSYTEDKETAEHWTGQGFKVVCRTKLTGHSGEGIVIASTPAEVVDAKLYVLYVPKKEEFRVHVFDDEVIDVQRKARKKSVPAEKVNWQIRNVKNGFIYMRKDIEVPEVVTSLALKVMAEFDLDFGAVDIIFSRDKKDYKHNAYALEINTAVGLEGSTIQSYVDAIKKFVTK